MKPGKEILDKLKNRQVNVERQSILPKAIMLLIIIAITWISDALWAKVVVSVVALLLLISAGARRKKKIIIE